MGSTLAAAERKSGRLTAHRSYGETAAPAGTAIQSPAETAFVLRY
jgi:hypothetical protein